jgi:hypothetical protein
MYLFLLGSFSQEHFSPKNFLLGTL